MKEATEAETVLEKKNTGVAMGVQVSREWAVLRSGVVFLLDGINE